MTKFEMAVNYYKKYIITAALNANHWNKTAAAKSLGMHRNTMSRYCNELAIEPNPAATR